VDAVVVQGNSTAIAAKVNEHLVAAADHVALLPSIGGEFVAGVTDSNDWPRPWSDWGPSREEALSLGHLPG